MGGGRFGQGVWPVGRKSEKSLLAGDPTSIRSPLRASINPCFFRRAFALINRLSLLEDSVRATPTIRDAHVVQAGPKASTTLNPPMVETNLVTTSTRLTLSTSDRLLPPERFCGPRRNRSSVKQASKCFQSARVHSRMFTPARLPPHEDELGAVDRTNPGGRLETAVNVEGDLVGVSRPKVTSASSSNSGRPSARLLRAEELFPIKSSVVALRDRTFETLDTPELRTLLRRERRAADSKFGLIRRSLLVAPGIQS
jgi:hypothetical protein